MRRHAPNRATGSEHLAAFAEDGPGAGVPGAKGGPLRRGNFNKMGPGRDDLQHAAQGADNAITNAIDMHVQAEQARRGDDEDGPTGVLVPLANSPDGIL